jgi:hypothetical protein
MKDMMMDLSDGERERLEKTILLWREKEGRKLPKLSDGGDALGNLTLEGGGGLPCH